MYEATVSTPSSSPSCRRSGFDVVDPEPTADGVAVDLVLSRGERAAVARPRDRARALPRRERRAPRRSSPRAQAAGGFTVWRDYDGTDGIRQYLSDFVAAHREDREAGRDRDHDPGPRDRRRADHQEPKTRATAAASADGKDRPAVLYQGTTHAREWISTEVTRRLMEYFAGNSTTAQEAAQAARALVRPGRQPRRLPVHVRRRAPLAQEPARQRRRRPDHQPRRRRPEPQLPRALGLRRRGLGARDLLRHLPRARGRPPSPRRRPTSTSSSRIDPVMARSATTPTARCCSTRRAGRCRRPARDLPIYLALTGNDDEPGGRGLRPGRLGRALHHQRRVHRLGARTSEDVLAWTPELERGLRRAAASSSPTTRRWSSASSRSTCRSRSTWRARRPTRRGRSRTSATRPSRSTSSSTSDGPDVRQQPARRLPLRATPTAIRSRSRCSPATRCASVTLNYRINGGRDAAAPAPGAGRAARPSARATTPTTAIRRGDGPRHRPGRLGRGLVHGQRRGKAKRQGQAARGGHGGLRSDSFTYEAVSESGAGTLVVAAEDYTGISPAQAGGPNYLDYYTDALTANGIAARRLRRRRAGPRGARRARRARPLRRRRLVHGRRRDHPRAGDGPGHRLAARQRRDARDARVHERGRQRPLHGQERRRPVPGRLRRSTRSPTSPAAPVRRRSPRAASCSRATSSSTTWAPTCSTTAAASTTTTGEPFPVHGLSAPFDGLRLDPQRRRRRRQPGLRRTRS